MALDFSGAEKLNPAIFSINYLLDSAPKPQPVVELIIIK